jgi:Ribbon-helix-helix protein, copG family
MQTTTDTCRVEFLLPADLAASLRELAANEDRTVSQELRRLVRTRVAKKSEAPVGIPGLRDDQVEVTDHGTSTG